LRHGVLVSVTILLSSVAACLSCDVRSRDCHKHLQIIRLCVVLGRFLLAPSIACRTARYRTESCLLMAPVTHLSFCLFLDREHEMSRVKKTPDRKHNAAGGSHLITSCIVPVYSFLVAQVA